MDRKLKRTLSDRLRPIIERILKEGEEDWRGTDIKAADGIVQALAKMPYPKHSTNNREIHAAWDEADRCRRKLMELIEANTGYEYKGGSNGGWKLIKKR